MKVTEEQKKKFQSLEETCQRLCKELKEGRATVKDNENAIADLLEENGDIKALLLQKETSNESLTIAVSKVHATVTEKSKAL